MSGDLTIRSLYQPLQPALRQADDTISYREWLPDIRLQPYVYCYWQLKTREPLAEAFSYRVVADGCIDIFTECHRPEQSFITGFSGRYTAFSLGHAFHYTGIRFLPAMLPVCFPVKASELSYDTLALDTVLPEIATFFKERFHCLMSEMETITLLDSYLLRHMAAMRPREDHRMMEAVSLILEQAGTLPVAQLGRGISTRQLRRLFEHYIGDTPKVFSKVVRFQNLLLADPAFHSLRRSKRFFDLGYYDQAHFIKEFQQLYGLTPGQVFRD